MTHGRSTSHDCKVNGCTGSFKCSKIYNSYILVQPLWSIISLTPSVEFNVMVPHRPKITTEGLYGQRSQCAAIQAVDHNG
jgi:hypothetical protein